jgi:YVTN family beta-propeller protein
VPGIPGTPGPTGPAGGGGIPANNEPSNARAYTVNTCDNTVDIYDATTGKKTGSVNVGTSPTNISVNPTTKYAYVSNQESPGTITVINTQNNQVVATVPVGDYPGKAVVNPATNMIYVPSTDSQNVTVINGNTNAVVATIPATGLPSTPSGTSAVAINPVTNQIYIADYSNGQISVVDGTTNTVTNTISGMNYVTNIGVNPNTNTVYATGSDQSNGRSALFTIDGANNTLTNTSILPEPGTPKALWVDPVNNQILIPTYYALWKATLDGDISNAVPMPSYAAGQMMTGGADINPSTGNYYVAGDYGTYIADKNGNILQAFGSRCTRDVAHVDV